MLVHQLLKLAASPGARRFRRDTGRLQSVQREKLSRLLAGVAASPRGRAMGVSQDWRWEDFSERLPVTDYEDWAGDITAAREQGRGRLSSSPVVRYQPTSGSTSAVKWIPYTGDFLAELDAAITPWIADLYRHYPRIGAGRHYWSMSWVPTEMRASMRNDINDDLQLMSLGKRLLAGASQSVPQDVSLAPSSDDSLFATLAWLAADKGLSMLSVWSPTFGLGLLRALARWREPLAEVLEKGQWGGGSLGTRLDDCPGSKRAASLLRDWDGQMSADFFARLWPSLALVSAWDTAASAPWAGQLCNLLPGADFQGKGLWATEGVVTLPVEGRYPLAYQSHVYEFLDPTDDRVYAPWELERGQQVMPLLTTGSGLLRYRLKDLVVVDDFMGQVPCLRFLGRAGTTDLVGEKLSTPVVQQALDALALPATLAPVSLLAVDDSGSGLPGYLLLLQGDSEHNSAAVAEILDAALQAHFHYQLARNLGQLAPVRAVVSRSMHELYLDQCRQRGMIEGNIKIEALQYWPGDLPMALTDNAAQLQRAGGM
ncbi:MAG: GH3 auxin-responsive promoter family protein [Alcanivorax sp.]|nr:GH3 auxin-responsive promoter family protein [Alcanivorax sp.]